jgi:hypothetical protein
MKKYTVARISVDADGEWAVSVVFPPGTACNPRSDKAIPKAVWGVLTRKTVKAATNTLQARLQEYMGYYIDELRKRETP